MSFPPRGIAPARPGAGLFRACHLLALPGASRFGGKLKQVIERACLDVEGLSAGGVDAVIVENFGDAPFFKDGLPPETVAAMSAVTLELARAFPDLPLGVNCLRNDAHAALALCAATGARFIRVNVHTGAMWTDQGLIEGRAADTLRLRARLCPDVSILADVHVKHAAPVAAQPLEAAARDTLERGLADALIVSGVGTGEAVDASELVRVREAVGAAPVLIGSGLTPDNAAALLALTDGAIVGTALEADGHPGAPVELERVRKMRAAFDALG